MEDSFRKNVSPCEWSEYGGSKFNRKQIHSYPYNCLSVCLSVCNKFWPQLPPNWLNSFVSPFLSFLTKKVFFNKIAPTICRGYKICHTDFISIQLKTLHCILFAMAIYLSLLGIEHPLKLERHFSCKRKSQRKINKKNVENLFHSFYTLD